MGDLEKQAVIYSMLEKGEPISFKQRKICFGYVDHIIFSLFIQTLILFPETHRYIDNQRKHYIVHIILLIV